MIDDGSKDRTAMRVSHYAHTSPNIVKLLRRPNGGKARTMNYGLLFARGEIFVMMDADSCLDRDAVASIVSIMRYWRSYSLRYLQFRSTEVEKGTLTATLSRGIPFS